ncbi:MAG TPA: hypothetical protein VEQ34_07630 [Pyrinomonadaceae bacterium]|nr:hypothetical protein [Pyrinomonadaceae bacterium]
MKFVIDFTVARPCGIFTRLPLLPARIETDARIQMPSFAKELSSGNFVTFKIFRRLMSKVTFSPKKSQNRASCSEKTLER